MKRLFLIFLLVLLPLQMSWAVAANYCQHEQGKATQHFGHHDHKHHASNDDNSTKQDKNGSTKVDNDCGYCHLSGAQIPYSITPMTASPPLSAPVQPQLFFYLSHIPDGLLRPDWRTAI